jgi:hypothetical protein
VLGRSGTDVDHLDVVTRLRRAGATTTWPGVEQEASAEVADVLAD